jgi:hypothetical protein
MAAGVASLNSIRLYGIAVVLGTVLALALSGSARAQNPGSELDFLSSPVILGQTYIGRTLTASGATWISPNPDQTYLRWEWWRCPTNAVWQFNCRSVSTSQNYVVAADSQRPYVKLARYSCYPLNRCSPTRNNPFDEDLVVSSARGPVTTAPAPTPTPVPTRTPTPAPTRTPTPVPTRTPTPVPTPAPTFDVAAPTPTPVPTSGQVLQQSASRRVISPFPVVRMRGRLTFSGARVTMLSVRAPRSATVTVRCKGSCPSRRWSRGERKSALMRVRPFERSLRAGTVITVSITRSGYIGKRTVFVIRRGQAPRRSDRCLSVRRSRVIKCPGR